MANAEARAHYERHHRWRGSRPYGRRRACARTAFARASMSRDPTGDKFLECAVSGNADYLVSADADLLSLREVRGIPILDAPTFWRLTHRTR